MSTATVNVPAAAQPRTRVLAVTDRCDRCGAQAYVRTSPGQMLWCAHHFRAHEPALTAAKITATADDRWALTEKASPQDE